MKALVRELLYPPIISEVHNAIYGTCRVTHALKVDLHKIHAFYMVTVGIKKQWKNAIHEAILVLCT
jgi:hypothetical protein